MYYLSAERFIFARFFAWKNILLIQIQGGNARALPRVNKIGGAERMAAGARVKITLRCEECKQRNYNTVKNKKNTTGKLELNMFDPVARKHVRFKEVKLR